MARRLLRTVLVAGTVLIVLLAVLVVWRLSVGGSSTAAPGPNPGSTAAPGSRTGSPAAQGPVVPPPGEPPGVLPLPVTRPVLNPAVTDANLRRTVCTGTKKYRPPVRYTDQVKRIELSTPGGSFGRITDPRDGRVYQVPGYRGYAGLGPGDTDRVELDHFLPLSDGGDGYDPTISGPRSAGSPTPRWPATTGGRPTATSRTVWSPTSTGSSARTATPGGR